jgi:cytochrome oxidase Cu insertion factor (SCO1/SenC/PrrC family)
MSDETPIIEPKHKPTTETTAKPGPDAAAGKAPETAKKGSTGRTLMGPLLAVLAIIISVGLMFAARSYKTANPPVATEAGQQPTKAAKKSTTASTVQIGGPFTLVDHNNKAITDKTYAGKHMLIFFGYTFCPDVCPTALTTISNTLDIIGDLADNVVPLFISVDPSRDTPEHLKEYVGYFHTKMVALTGTEEQIKAVTKVFRVYAAKAKTDNEDPEDYLMDHSSITYLMGPDGKFLEHFSHGMEPEKIAERLLKYL